jgi:catechol 2,3-dioxygenase-like lactoylglutathione lyase family enzyme
MPVAPGWWAQVGSNHQPLDCRYARAVGNGRLTGKVSSQESVTVALCRVRLWSGLAVSPRLGRPGGLPHGGAMACRMSELVIDCRDPARLAAFWCDVLGFVELGREEGSIEIGPPGTGFGGLQPTIVFSPCSSPKAGKLRMHFDVNPTGCDQDAELARLLAAGARPADIGQKGDEGWHVLADPEGNEFCLLHTQLPG